MPRIKNRKKRGQSQQEITTGPWHEIQYQSKELSQEKSEQKKSQRFKSRSKTKINEAVDQLLDCKKMSLPENVGGMREELATADPDSKRE